MADFYQDMQNTASELMAEFKQGVVTYTPTTDTDWGAPTQGTPVSVNATVLGVSAKYISETISASDLEVTMGVISPAPTITGVITIDGLQREIIAIKPIPASGIPSVYKVFVKG